MRSIRAPHPLTARTQLTFKGEALADDYLYPGSV